MDWWIDDSLPVGPRGPSEFPDFSSGSSISYFSTGGVIDPNVPGFNWNQHFPDASARRATYEFQSVGRGSQSNFQVAMNGSWTLGL